MKKAGLMVIAGMLVLVDLSLFDLYVQVGRIRRGAEENARAIADVGDDIEELRGKFDRLQARLAAIEKAENELVYSIASEKTGCPIWILRGIQFAESSYGGNLEHPDPWDTGPFGLHERPSFHAERAQKWGEYDPKNNLDAAIIAGRIIMENMAILGSEDGALSSYRRGVAGTRARGLDRDYIAMVKAGGIL
jgi:hypothetical protein